MPLATVGTQESVESAVLFLQFPLFLRDQTICDFCDFCVTKFFALFLGYLMEILYLCGMKEMIEHLAQSMGRTELAIRYFPHIQPQNAWQKLRGLIAEDPELCHLATLRRRTFLPVEVNKIYQVLGRP